MTSSENRKADAGLPFSRKVSGVDVVLFDYGQVLSTPPDPIAWSRMQMIAGLSDAKLHEAYWRFRHDYDRDALNGTAYWGEVARHAGVSLTEEQVEALMAADADLWMQPNAPMVAWAGQLQRAGVRTAILSNIGDAMAERVSARLEWLNAFELCVWSYALRMAKPEAEIFRTAAEMLKTAPQQILFIDDKEENVAAARAAGMQAVRYAAHDEFVREMRERGFSSLLEVCA
ncbi:MAG TPA: HAD family phosphatase [Acidobacteriaceae bacterium]